MIIDGANYDGTGFGYGAYEAAWSKVSCKTAGSFRTICLGPKGSTP